MLNPTFGMICAVLVAILAYFVLRNFYDATTSDIMQSSLVLALLVGLGLMGTLVREHLRNKK
jgi:hypothetical protein